MDKELLVEWSQGNPGALRFLMRIYNSRAATLILSTLGSCKSIRGTNLYVLHADLCDKDLNKVYQLCRHCPHDILEDACSRQDNSGKELVAKYLE